MSTLGTIPTLLDWSKMLGPDNRISVFIEMLAQMNGIQKVMPFMQGNLPTGHRTIVQTTLPTVSWRAINGFVSGSKGTTAQADFQTGMLEGFLEVDEELLDLNGDRAQFKTNQSRMFLEAIRQEVAQTSIYGNEATAQEEFTGLQAYYNAISGGISASNIINGAGSGSVNASIYLVHFSEDGITGVVPKGSSAGISVRDLGPQLIQSGTTMGSGRMVADVTQFKLKAGLVVADWRQGVRICNIDTDNLASGSSDADIIELMIKATHRIFAPGKGKGYWFVNRTIKQYLDLQAYRGVKAGGGITYATVDGQEVMMFRGRQVVVEDALLDTEATVS